MKELLKSTAGREDLLDLTREDLAYALLRCMQERRGDPIHPVNRDSAVSELFSITDPISPMERRALEKKLNMAFREAFEQLESWELIEPAEGENGKNGYIVLTEKGVKTNARVDFEGLRQRRLLVSEMLHPALRGDVYADFLAGKFGKAVFGAFKIVEIQVRQAARLSEAEYGAALMQVAFNEKNGSLTDPNETPSQQKALRMLFEGALGRFRNPEGHTDRVFADAMEPMQELMLASRLLRLLDGRPVKSDKRQKS
jgi:uncharacterized protein (TIGR02391 family)